MKIFDALLEIKRFREEQAELSVGRERRRMAEAARARREAEISLQQFREKARIEEDGMYADLCGRIVRVREIDGVLQRVAGLRDGERQCDDVREQAEKTELAAEQSLKGARLVHQQAVRQCDKFVDLAGVYLAEEVKERDSKEDAEIEEVASAAWRPREWDDDIEGCPA
ncbi:type III secretion system stalk subunit SctO [Achromobacter marplatensis]|uniref:type III secretion system stalk subunit SctO n=1 Tax=Achromobacter marplatensis TaxID=470868 RepID=UPI0039F6879C